MRPWADREEELKKVMLKVAKKRGPLNIQDFHNSVIKEFCKTVDDVLSEKCPPELLRRQCVMELLDSRELELLPDRRLGLHKKTKTANK